MSGIYQLLAQDCNDALAMFAYAAYKQHKSDVIEAILTKTGRPATEEDLAAFYLIASTPSMRAMYVQRAESMMNSFLRKTLQVRRRELESKFLSTKIGEQLQAIQAVQQRKRSWKGWAADVSGNLAVNFVTILVIAALLFGFRGLDQMLNEFGRNSGVLSK
ncbi:hypothetical protein Jab_1c00340 [Janthinobacterium sp. HH01]|uniref:hypothetical protein n=1 Tax=Janthinobacterium sp. HH01 TaxID=1198452 RepID=UPI0002AE9436|nr:hypothetical protein [Janthinobacterium sp. HH01]ELX11451.1 hypothetical protein Jab_1c00340 [Janthinobacterium sp. HH01]